MCCPFSLQPLEEEDFELIPTIDENEPSPTTYGAPTKPHH